MFIVIPLTFFVGLLATLLLIRISKSINLLDEANDRSSHYGSIPRGGGVAIIVGCVFGVILYLLLSQKNITNDFRIITIGTIVLFCVGLVDDFYNLSVSKRFVAQTATSVLTLCWFYYHHEGWAGSINIILSLYILAAIAMVWWINLFNFMDGIDGIASVEIISLSLIYIIIIARSDSVDVLGEQLTWILFILLSSTIAFLIFNWSPAKIFMGDSGSLSISYLVCCLALIGYLNKIAPIWCWLIPASVFVADATFTLLRRMLSGETWWLSHNTHIYQKLAKLIASKYSKKLSHSRGEGRTVSHRLVSLLIGVANLVWLLPITLYVQNNPDKGLIGMLIALFPIIGGIIAVQLWTSNRRLYV